jgi:site-specific recombinase XerD
MVLLKAGITDFAPHSFRSASSSAMIRNGVSLEAVLKKGDWSNAKTFQKFYNRSCQDSLQNSIRKQNSAVQASILNYTKRNTASP